MIATASRPDAVPETLQGIVAARIDGLRTREAAAPHAAVLGKVFWTDGAAAIADAAREGWTSGCSRSSARSSCAASGVGRRGARQYAFVHALVREGVRPDAARRAVARAPSRAAWIASLPGGPVRGPGRGARPPLAQRDRVRRCRTPGRRPATCRRRGAA